MQYTIDAKNKPLGRVASEVALILQGKKNPSYDPRKEGNDSVLLKNALKVVVTGRKAEQKKYYHHSGPLGHLKEERYEEKFAKDPTWIIRHAVRLMLPKNRLNVRRMKRLTIEL